VRAALIRDHGVAPERLIAEGVGYLAPRVRNDTAEGRALNRRVEAVVTSER
jgi:OOP family OmpA-OmpF porin